MIQAFIKYIFLLTTPLQVEQRTLDEFTYSNRMGASEAMWWNPECIDTYRVYNSHYRLHTKYV